MNPGTTMQMETEALRTQLRLHRLGSRNRLDIEWASALMNSLVEAQVNGISDGLYLEWGDRPDFRLNFPNYQRHLEFEVTMAASEAHQAAMRAMGSDGEITHLEPAVYSSDPGLSSRHKEAGIGRNWKRLGGKGWAGSEAESQWVDFILAAIVRKAIKYQEYGFDQLMIYDDSPLVGWINPFMAIRMLRKRPSIKLPFSINIWTDTSFAYDLYGNCILYNAEKANLTMPKIPHIRMSLLDSPGENVFEMPFSTPSLE